MEIKIKPNFIAKKIAITQKNHMMVSHETWALCFWKCHREMGFNAQFDQSGSYTKLLRRSCLSMSIIIKINNFIE